MVTKRNQRDKNDNYRKTEAMYRKGYSVSEICTATEQSPISVICTMQKIFAMDQRK